MGVDEPGHKKPWKYYTKEDCDGCYYLNMTEHEQDIKGLHHVPHWCDRYNERVKHNKQHPKLPRIPRCKVHRPVKIK